MDVGDRPWSFTTGELHEREGTIAGVPCREDPHPSDAEVGRGTFAGVNDVRVT